MDKPKITVVSGTNRPDSTSLRIAGNYAEMLESMGHPAQVLNLQDLPDDFTSTALYDLAGTNARFNVISKVINDSQKFVFIVPEYNGSFPGVLKAFIDGLDYQKAFWDKKAGIIGLSDGTQGAALAISHLVDIFNYLGMHVLAARPRLAGINSLLTDEGIDNKLYNQMLREHAEAMVRF